MHCGDIYYDEEEHFRAAIAASEEEQNVKASNALISNFRNGRKRELESEESESRLKSRRISEANISLPNDLCAIIVRLFYGDLKTIASMSCMSRFMNAMIKEHKLNDFILINDAGQLKEGILKRRLPELKKIVLVFNEVTAMKNPTTIFKECLDPATKSLEIHLCCDSISAEAFFEAIAHGAEALRAFKSVNIAFKNINHQSFFEEFKTRLFWLKTSFYAKPKNRGMPAPLDFINLS